MDAQPQLPPGSGLIPDWITTAQEVALSAFLDAGEWSGELKRRVRHFGYRYDYRARSATRDSRIGPLPEVLQKLAERLVAEGLFAAVPDQVIANEYLPGQGISAHVDCEPCSARWWPRSVCSRPARCGLAALKAERHGR